MKANRKALTTNDEGVATAVGAVLLVSLLFMAFLIVETSFVPRWEEDAEERHSREAQREFLGIVTQMEARAENGTLDPTSMTVSMMSGSTGIFASSLKLPGELLMTTTPFGSTFNTTEMAIASSNGVPLAVLQESWTGITGTHTLSDLASVSHLRLRVTDPGNDVSGDNIVIEIKDVNDQSAGTLTVHVETYASGWALRIKAANPTPTTISDNGLTFFTEDKPSFVYLNILEPSTFFTNLVAAAEGPFSLEFAENGLGGSFSVQATTASGDPISGASPGPTVSNVLRQSTSGRLELSLPNQQFPQQSLVLDHGAVVVKQPDGVAFLQPPRFEVGPLGAISQVTIADTGAGGVSRGVTSHNPVRVTLGDTIASSLKGTSPDATWNITTPWPALWASHWDNELVDAGWDSTAGHYSISTGADWARLHLTGNDPGTTHDLLVDWRQATITTTLET